QDVGQPLPPAPPARTEARGERQAAMFRPLEVAATEGKTSFCALGPQPLDPAAVARQAPGAMWLLASADGSAVARCSLWWEDTPEYQGHRIGYVGHYAVT